MMCWPPWKIRRRYARHRQAARRPAIAFTTDSFVVRPLFFPGGDIGRLAVHGTVNDLAVGGARPLFLSAAFILEEGLPLADLKRIVDSMRQACAEAGVYARDRRHQGRGSRQGRRRLYHDLGHRHGAQGPVACRFTRRGPAIAYSFPARSATTALPSCRCARDWNSRRCWKATRAPLNGLTEAILEACPNTRCMRDPTRGGLSSALNELAAASRVGVKLDEAAIPLRPEVRGACEMLGLDPLYVANEGKLIAVVPPEDAERALSRDAGASAGPERRRSSAKSRPITQAW